MRVLSHDTNSNPLILFSQLYTYTVQDIITTVLPYGLTVECVFAVEQNTCTVFLVLDDSDKGKHHWRMDIYQPTNIGLVLETVLWYIHRQACLSIITNTLMYSRFYTISYV